MGNVLVGHPPLLFYDTWRSMFRCVARQRLIGLYKGAGGDEMVLNEGSNRSGEITFLLHFQRNPLAEMRKDVQEGICYTEKTLTVSTGHYLEKAINKRNFIVETYLFPDSNNHSKGQEMSNKNSDSTQHSTVPYEKR
ncbi:hypothetical protein CEXT_75451 [Caerostris extrusa]|uniref:Uncharacterized protein n=1 Tax=Caerostris extrusa TaxID=172846 RepID=A0AAV4XYE2_CAEEX|nr:hypothetical protein CEXT_75451 [Caerostris extrusa]